MPSLNAEHEDLLYPRVAAYFYGTPWAILPEKLAVMQALLHFRAMGGRLTAEQIAINLGAERACDDCDDGPGFRAARQSSSYGRAGSVAVLPVRGILSHRAGMFTDSSGGTSVEGLTSRLREALADPSVGGIVLDVDSPGGSVFGIQELADEIRASAGEKPIWAVANSQAASAAYWLASAAQQLSVISGGDVGAIGVFTAHNDLSKAMEREGVKTTLISAGKYKVETNPYEPLSEEARAALQARVDEYYQAFTRGVARGRGASVDQVRNGFGEGRAVTAANALKLGMVDRIETLDQAIARMQAELAGARQSTRAAALAEPEEIAAAAEPEAESEPVADPTAELDLRRRRLRLAAHSR